MGGDRDEHGCIGSAGYSWSEKMQQCLRPWENPEAFEDSSGESDMETKVEDDLELLFVVTAASGSLTPVSGAVDTTHKLVLNDVSKFIAYFSDRPARIAGHMPLQEIIDLWNEGEDSFEIDPPNVALEVMVGEEVVSIIAELRNPEYDPQSDTISFDAKVLSEGDIPEEFGAAGMIIDNWFKKAWHTVKHKAKKTYHHVTHVVKKAVKKGTGDAEEIKEFVKILGQKNLDFVNEVVKGNGHYPGAKMTVGDCKGDAVWAHFNHDAMLLITWKAGVKIIDKAQEKAIEKAVESWVDSGGGAEAGAEAGAEEASVFSEFLAPLAAYVLANYVAMVEIDVNNNHKGAYINAEIESAGIYPTQIQNHVLLITRPRCILYHYKFL